MNFAGSLSNGAAAPVRRAAFFDLLVAARCVALFAVALAAVPNAAHADELTLERLFAAPDLSGPTLRGAKISPDGRLIAYLKARDDDKDRFDLWAFDIAKREHRQLVDSRTLAGADKALSAEEEARRERQRTAALSGIVEYSFAPVSHQLLIPLNVDLYLYDIGR